MSNNVSTHLVTVEYRDNNRIQIIHVNNMTRQTVDAYIEIIRTEIVNREASFLLSVHDYSNINNIVSPYFLGRLKELASDNLRPDLFGRAAIVTSIDLFRLLFNPVVKIFSRNNNGITIQFFNSVDEAIEWVSEYEE
jgi:hypothetical protein